MHQGETLDLNYLKPTIRLKDIDELLIKAKREGSNSICVLPHYVDYCQKHLQETNIFVSTVIGYPYGLSTIETKVFETLNAKKNGAKAICFVINMIALKNKDINLLKTEMIQIRKAARDISLSVIIDMSQLTETEKIEVERIYNEYNIPILNLELL